MDNRTVKYLISRIREQNTLLDTLTNNRFSTNNLAIRDKLKSRINTVSEKRKHYLKQLRHKGEGTIIQVKYTISNDTQPSTEPKNMNFINLTKEDARDLMEFWAEVNGSKLEILEIKEIEIKV